MRVKQLDVDCETKSQDHGVSFPTFVKAPRSSLRIVSLFFFRDASRTDSCPR
jgi:hypothetical protein